MDERVQRWNPGPGFRHVLRPSDIHRFVDRMPHSMRPPRILLAPGEMDLDGWHGAEFVAVCAWPLARAGDWFAPRHAGAVERFGHPRGWSDETIRRFQLEEVLRRESERRFSLRASRTRSSA